MKGGQSQLNRERRALLKRAVVKLQCHRHDDVFGMTKLAVRFCLTIIERHPAGVQNARAMFLCSRMSDDSAAQLTQAVLLRNPPPR